MQCHKSAATDRIPNRRMHNSTRQREPSSRSTIPNARRSSRTARQPSRTPIACASAINPTLPTRQSGRQSSIASIAARARQRNACLQPHLYEEDSGLREQQFATPELDVRYADGDKEAKVESVTIIGYTADDGLVNSFYDEKTMTIQSHDKWRGLGDASSSGTWLFRNGDFTLVKYDVDASYDESVRSGDGARPRNRALRTVGVLGEVRPRPASSAGWSMTSCTGTRCARRG